MTEIAAAGLCVGCHGPILQGQDLLQYPRAIVHEACHNANPQGVQDAVNAIPCCSARNLLSTFGGTLCQVGGNQGVVVPLAIQVGHLRKMLDNYSAEETVYFSAERSVIPSQECWLHSQGELHRFNAQDWTEIPVRPARNGPEPSPRTSQVPQGDEGPPLHAERTPA